MPCGSMKDSSRRSRTSAALLSRCASFRKSRPGRQSRCSHSRSGMKNRLGSAPRASRRDLGDHKANGALKPLKTSRRSTRQPEFDASGSRGEGMVAEGLQDCWQYILDPPASKMGWKRFFIGYMQSVKCPVPEQKAKEAGVACHSLPVRSCSQIHAPFGSLISINSCSRNSKHIPWWGITPYILDTHFLLRRGLCCVASFTTFPECGWLPLAGAICFVSANFLRTGVFAVARIPAYT